MKQYARAAAPRLRDAEWEAQLSPVAGTGGSASDMASREAWKYGAFRGATGTPAVFVNDLPFVPFGVATTPWNASQWVDALSKFGNN